MEMLRTSSLGQATRDACVVLVNDSVSDSNGDVLKTNSACQNVMNMQLFNTWPEMTQFLALDVGQSLKLLIMAERCRRLGIVRPSERSVAAIVAIPCGDAAGVGRARPEALQAVRQFKTILHRDQGGDPSDAVGV